MVGPRSALFTPFSNLGLIFVDEEQEGAYNSEQIPRYHTRETADKLAQLTNSLHLLGSATPSIESFSRAESGEYRKFCLTKRAVLGRCLPNVQDVDMRKELASGNRSVFSRELREKMEECLAKKQQMMLFINRRGFSRVVSCRSCGKPIECPHCDVALTEHLGDKLVCHYCGYTYRLPQVCPECKGTEFKMQGFGTEKVEEEIAGQFPAAKVERLDFDTARTRTAYERIISDFEKGKTQILIGTQMLSKGLDFGNVSVVGILSADSLMNFPDFRAHERAYQLMVQVSGRAGRRDKRGTVILQTTQPEHPLIRMVQHFAYKEMVSLQLSERSMFRYPPYYRLIVLILRSRNEEALQEMSALYAEKLRARLGERVLGPVTPPITRVQTLHIKKIVLKIEISAGIAPLREILEGIHTEMQGYVPFKQLLVHYDVDPA